MRRLLACLMLGCFALVACAASGPAPVRAAVLPELEVLTLAGQASSLSGELAGKVTLIDLWATWCTACERQQPKLERLHAAYADRGLRVVGLDVGEAPSVVRDYLKTHRVTYPVYVDPEFRLADSLGDHQLPTLLLVDRDGRIVQRAAALDQALLERLKTLLARPGQESAPAH